MIQELEQTDRKPVVELMVSKDFVNKKVVSANPKYEYATMTAQELLRHLQDGYSICVSMTSNKERKGDYFRKTQLFHLDIDGETSKEMNEILALCDKYDLKPMLIMETASSTEDSRRWRVLFRANTTFLKADIERYKSLQRKLYWLFLENGFDVDKVCTTDIVRQYFGNNGKGIATYTSNVETSITAIERLPDIPEKAFEGVSNGSKKNINRTSVNTSYKKATQNINQNLSPYLLEQIQVAIDALPDRIPLEDYKKCLYGAMESTSYDWRIIEMFRDKSNNSIEYGNKSSERYFEFLVDICKNMRVDKKKASISSLFHYANYYGNYVRRTIVDDFALVANYTYTIPTHAYFSDVAENAFNMSGNAKHILIKAPMGFGKSTWVKKYAENNPDVSILYLVNRISCVEQVTEDLSSLGFVSYDKINDGNYIGHRRYISTFKSLYKAMTRDAMWDVVIIDECDNTMSDFEFVGGKNQKIFENYKQASTTFDYLHEVIGRSDFSVHFDATMTDVYRQTMCEIHGKDCVFAIDFVRDWNWQFSHRHENLIHFTTSQSAIGYHALKAINEKKTVMVIMDSKKQGVRLKKWIEAARKRERKSKPNILLIHGDNNKESVALQFLSNPDKYFENEGAVLIASPAVGQGVSIMYEVDVLFVALYGVASPDQAIQYLRRVRKPIQTIVFCQRKVGMSNDTIEGNIQNYIENAGATKSNPFLNMLGKMRQKDIVA